MNRIDYCPICKSKHLDILKRFRYCYPGGKISENVLDMRYVRLWILFEKILRHREPVEFNSVLCKSCGLIFTNPRFSSEEISIKYAWINNLQSVKKLYRDNPASKLDVRSNRIYSLIKKLHSSQGKMRVLDYGGAWGYNLLNFVKAGDLGYILDYEKWDIPAGIEYMGRDLMDLEQKDLFDVILCLHTLEHAIEPMEMLCGLSNHLSEQGLLYVEVPLGCLREYKNINEPLTHVNFFSEESLYKSFRSLNLNVLHLSTAYQSITLDSQWCINIIGSKDRKNNISRYKTTKKQMNDLKYYVPLFGKKIMKTFYL